MTGAGRRAEIGPRPDPAVGWSRAHRAGGFLLVVLFAASGAYMRLRDPPVADLAMEHRMLFRSRHIYLLMIGLVHLALGSGGPWPHRRVGWRRVGSGLLWVSASALAAAFAVEAALGVGPSPLTQLGLYTALAGTGVHFLASWSR